MQIGENLNGAKYKMVIYIDWMDMGNGASGFMPWSGSKAGGVIIKADATSSTWRQDSMCAA